MNVTGQHTFPGTIVTRNENTGISLCHTPGLRHQLLHYVRHCQWRRCMFTFSLQLGKALIFLRQMGVFELMLHNTEQAIVLPGLLYKVTGT